MKSMESVPESLMGDTRQREREAVASHSSRLTVRDITRAVRTRQWAKNALLFAGFIFAGHLRAGWPTIVAEGTCVLLAFVCFCALSGATYLINDWSDIERDRLHPLKRLRPLASGRMSTTAALFLIVLLLVVAVLSAAVIVRQEARAWGFPIAAFIYLVLTLAYSFVWWPAVWRSR
jgi:decaprenyl-phosphate phosphoribosyltransferase